MAHFIRKLDPNHLIISGGYVKSGAALDVKELDLIGVWVWVWVWVWMGEGCLCVVDVCRCALARVGV